MRNFKKVFALVISMAAIATTVSAADLTYEVTGLTGSYVKDANALTLTVDGATGDKTVLVLDKDANEDDVAGEDILYINQYADGDTAYTEMGLKGTTALAEGRYPVKIWYSNAADDAILEGEIVVAPGEAEGTKITVKWGDITGDDVVDGKDSMTILMKYIGVAQAQTVKGYDVVVGEKLGDYKWGDVTGDDVVDGKDSMTVLMKYIGVAQDQTVNGQTITVGSDLDILVK